MGLERLIRVSVKMLEVCGRALLQVESWCMDPCRRAGFGGFLQLRVMHRREEETA